MNSSHPLNKSSKLASILGEDVQELPVEEGLVFMRDKETDAGKIILILECFFFF
jgi:hypothetical protein